MVADTNFYVGFMNENITNSMNTYKTANDSFLKDCAYKAVMLFMAREGLKDEKSCDQMLSDLFEEMESIYHGFNGHHADGLRSFGFDMSKMSLDERRSILFQMALCRVLSRRGLV